jgi:hypothetical protein
MLSIDSAHPQKVDGMHRNRWTTYSGFSGRLAPESVVAIDRITQKEASATHVADVAHCDLMPQCAQEQGDYCRKGREEEKRR